MCQRQLESEVLMNTLLYIGLGFITLGFLLFVVSIIMERHYEVKLWELEQRNKYDTNDRRTF